MNRLWPTLACLLTAASAAAAEPAPSLRLSHRRAMELGMTSVLQGQIARDLRDQIRQAAEQERGPFDWTLFAAAGTGHLRLEDDNPKISGLGNLFESDARSTQTFRSASLGIGKLLPTGGTLSLAFNPAYAGGRFDQLNHPIGSTTLTPVGYDTLNPYGGRVSFSFNQPLLRGAGRTAAEARLQAALKAAEGADFAYRRRLADLLVATDALYWDLAYARQNLENKRRALELTRKQLTEDQERVKAGMLARIELPAVEATVAERERQVLQAEARAQNAEAALLARLFPDDDRPGGLELADAPTVEPVPWTLDSAKDTALAHRPELGLARAEVEADRIREAAAQNALRPQLDAQVAYLGSAASRSSLGDVWSDWSQGRYPGYQASLVFSVPLGNHGARARLSQARAARHGAELSARDLRQGVLLEVQQAYTDLASARKEVEAADKALAFRMESLESEMAKVENGMSTSFFVLQRQDELDQAQATALEARVGYRKALASLKRAMGTLVDPSES